MSSCSIEQDENLVLQFSKTPGTPTKTLYQTPRRSSRKRCLFQPINPGNSPAKSDDLGPMSPLSVSSSDSYMSHNSPILSPNGKFSTPPKTPTQSSTREEGRVSTRKIEVKSSLFPNLKLNNVKSHKSPVTPRRSQRLTPGKSAKKVPHDILRELTTPPKSSKKITEIAESDPESSQNILDSTPCCPRKEIDITPVSTSVIRNIPSENFYGPTPPASKARTQLFADIIFQKNDNGKRNRSLSLDSISSNRSFVSGFGTQKKRRTGNVSRSKISKHGRQKGPFVGVWHGIKKPKKMKSAKNTTRPLISPKSRVAKMMEADKTNPIQVKSKRLFEEKPRRKIESRKKKNPESDDEDDDCVGDNGIIDSFPYNRIKRKRIPSSTHPSHELILQKVNEVPDPNKKFLKYGMRRKATFTLNENVKIQFTDGVMKLQSPKKRRKLYSGKHEMAFDFGDDEEKNSEVKENIENILSKLDDDKDIASSQKLQLQSPAKVLVEKITEDELLNILDSPRTKISLISESPSKVTLTEIQNDPESKLLKNLSYLDINDEEVTDLNFVESLNREIPKDNNSGSLEKTGSLLSHVRNILTNTDENYPLSEEESGEPKDAEAKFFSLFYKQNWNSQTSAKENNHKNSSKKKSVKVPDDQYLLDAGQKSVGIVTCGKCGVMYQSGDFADEATHRNFHNHLPELRFTGWTNERVVGRYNDGRVVMIVSADPKSWWHKVTKILDIVDQELGFPEGSVSALYYKTVYLFISDKAKQIVGCLIAEECKEAFKMFPPLEGVDVDSCSKDPSPCKVGISRIWTALNHRRRGVAKRMIDCMRRTFLFGEIVPLDLIAFSVPSPSGKLLAQNVTGKLDFLVYGFV